MHFLNFRDTFSIVRDLILICGEHLCPAIFKKWSAMSVSSGKLEKNVIEGIRKNILKIDIRRPDSNRGPLDLKTKALPLHHKNITCIKAQNL